MNVKKYKINNVPKYITILCGISILTLCFVHPMFPNKSEEIGNLSYSYISYNIILIVPVFMILNTLFDGILFFRYKFSCICAICWTILIYYLHCVFTIEKFPFDSYALFFFTALIPGITASITPFFIKKGDRTGLIPISRYDLLWIFVLFAIAVFFIMQFNMLKNTRTEPFNDRRSGKSYVIK